MPDPADLPLELFDLVLDQHHFATDVLSVPGILFEDDYTAQPFSACCLVSRRWNAKCTPRLYSRWISNNGTKHTLSRLWNFLRTILNKPELAAFVQFAEIRVLEYRGNYKDLPGEEQDLARNAIEMAGIAKAGSWKLRARDLTDGRVFLALLMICLPNLKRLAFWMSGADNYFTQVLRLASQDSTRRVFQHLSEISLSMLLPLKTQDRDLVFDQVWRAFRLPRIRKVSLYNMPYRYTNSDPDGDARASPITHLTAVDGAKYDLGFAAVKSLLTWPNRLVHLSLNYGHFSDPSKGIYSVSNVELSGLLALHQDSLEYLDLYRRRSKQLPFPNLTHTHMDVLRHFRALKSLMIHPEDLVGGCCGAPKASFRLRDSLSPNLRSLTFYVSRQFADMEDEITEAVSGKNLAQLKMIVLERTYNLVVEVRGSRDCVEASWPTLRGACKEMAIDFRIADPDTLPLGGQNLKLHYF